MITNNSKSPPPSKNKTGLTDRGRILDLVKSIREDATKNFYQHLQEDITTCKRKKIFTFYDHLEKMDHFIIGTSDPQYDLSKNT